jgi:hypothetical protein
MRKMADLQAIRHVYTARAIAAGDRSRPLFPYLTGAFTGAF